MTIAADPKHLGARIGFTAVLHTWGSALTHHPHVHMIVPGGGLSPDGIAGSLASGLLSAVRVLGALFRRLFLTLIALYEAGRLPSSAPRHVSPTAACSCAPRRSRNGSCLCQAAVRRAEAVLAYLSRYTHRVAISNRRLIALDENGVTFNYKDYRLDGPSGNTHDARAARVHPPLSDPRAAKRLPPHPPLRLAHQFSTQSKYCACPRAAWRRAPARACRIARAARSSPALSLLRRAHVHHRDLRALEATPRATSRICTNRERPLVTRHGLRSSHAATPPLRRMRQYTLFATISATGPNMSRGQLPIHGPPDETSHSTSPRRRQRRAGFAVTSSNKTSNPHRPSPQPRGFVHGRFPYRSHALTRDL